MAGSGCIFYMLFSRFAANFVYSVEKRMFSIFWITF